MDAADWKILLPEENLGPVLPSLSNSPNKPGIYRDVQLVRWSGEDHYGITEKDLFLKIQEFLKC